MSTVTMEATHPEPGDHRGAIESDFFKPGYWGTCDCGWRGSHREDVTKVMIDLRAHFWEVSNGQDWEPV